MTIRKYIKEDIPAMIRIWNKVVEDGVAFPQEEYLDEISGENFLLPKVIAALLKRMVRLRDYTFFTRITQGDWTKSRMRAMPWTIVAVESTSGKNWCWIVFQKRRNLALKSCSSMPLSKVIFTPVISMRDSDSRI